MSHVHLVHLVDTEGPLRESIEQTFDRLRRMFGIELSPSPTTLRSLQRQEIELGGQEAAVARVLSPQLLAYNEDWAAIEAMLDRLWSDPVREQLRDPAGRPWHTTWCCCDHVDYDTNPQGRDIGFHKVFDRYAAWTDNSESNEVEFHFHPMPHNRRANSNATHWFANSTVLFQIIARRILDRTWFPAVNRPGFHVTRPDSHWFLEQFIPFDFANQATGEEGATDEQRDLHGGRFGDWRRAPASWHPYHPSHDDYQRPGTCRRTIFRCLNVGTRFRLLSREHVEQAFREAQNGTPVALAFTNHDFRDIIPDCLNVIEMVRSVAKDYPGIAWGHASAREAARSVLGLKRQPSVPFLDLNLADSRLIVRADRQIFGPQPFLALRTADGQYFHDAMDVGLEPGTWSYTLDEQTVAPDRLSRIGVGACDEGGAVTAIHIDSARRVTVSHR